MNIKHKKLGWIILFVVGAFTVSIFSNSSPVITWKPEKIELALFRGTSDVSIVTFISKKDLEGINLEIVPELRKFVSVEPSSLTKVLSNIKNQINLIFSIPSNTELGNYEGTLHIKIKNKTHPRTLKIVLNIRESTAEEIPIDTIAMPTLERIYEDEETGAVYVRDEILIGFNEGIPGARIKEIVSGIGGVFLGSISGLDVYQVQIPVINNPFELETIIRQLEAYPEVKIATHHWIDTAHTPLINLNK